MNAPKIALASLILAAPLALAEPYHPVVARLQSKLARLDNESTRNAWDNPISKALLGPPNLTRAGTLRALAATMRQLTDHLRVPEGKEAKKEAATIVAALTSLSKAAWESRWPARVTAPLKIWDEGGEPNAWERERLPALRAAKAAYEDLKGHVEGRSGQVPVVVFRIARYRKTRGGWALGSNVQL